MNCEIVQGSLEDFRCGELEAGEAARMAAHLSSCPECSRRMADLQAEEQIYARYRADLDRKLEVPASMWTRIEAALGQPGHRRGIRGWLSTLPAYFPASGMARQALFAAALIVLSVGATLLAVRYYHHDGEPKVLARHSAGSPQTLQAALQSIQRAEQDYLNAIQVLSNIVEQRKSTLDPRLVAELDANLKAIDQSIADTRRAYHEHPTDAELAHYMLAAYSKKVELLQELAS